MIEVTLGGEKYLFNVLKPLSDKLSKAIFDKLHENMQVNMSSYKKKKFEAQRTDKRTFYVSGKAEVTTIYHFQNRKDGKKSKTYNDEHSFSETVEATSKEDAELQVRQKLNQQFDMEKEDSPQIIARSVKQIDFVTREPAKAQATEDMNMKSAKYVDYDFIPHESKE
jgi:hypothetical protein